MIPTNAGTLKPGDQFIVIAEGVALLYQCDLNDHRRVYGDGEKVKEQLAHECGMWYIHHFPVVIGGACTLEPWRIVWVPDGFNKTVIEVFQSLGKPQE